MRALSLSRVLALATMAGTAVLVLAENAGEGNAHVSAGDVLTVTSLSTPSSISVNAFATTITPVTTTAPPSSSSTTEPITTAPASSTATTGATSSPSTATPSTTTAPSTATGGSGVTCLFRYSMPTASNVAEELEKAAAVINKNKETTTDGSMDGSMDGSRDSSVSVGSKDSSPKPTSGSQGGTSTNAGSGGDAGGTTSKTPNPTTKTPATTTKAPTLTPSPTKTPKTPKASAGSSDGSVRRHLAGSETDDEPTPAPSPSSTSEKTPSPSPSSTKKSSTTTAPPASGSSSSKDSSPSAAASSSNTTSAAAGAFSCDATFYGAWSKLGLKCGEQELDVAKAVAQTQCLIYSGLQSSAMVSNMKMCMSVCRFPKCADDAWDYAATDGFSSAIYQNLNFMQLMRFAGASAAVAGAADEPFANLTMASDKQCDFASEASFSACKCQNLLAGKAAASDSTSSVTIAPSLTVPVDKGLADSDHWADGQVKNSLAKVSIGAAVIGSSAATVSVVAGGAMAVASGVMGTTSAGVATGVSAGASIGITIAAVDICQFSIMINQMNLDARPRFLEDMGRRMAPAGYGFLPFWKTSNVSAANATATRRLTDTTAAAANQTQGMERYAQVIGVQVDKLFYLTAAGVGALIAALFLVYGLVMAVCFPFVSDFGVFARKWLDKAIGVLMMILILSEYVIGVTATFQFCWCIDNNRIDASLFLSIFTLLVLAIGTILYGVVVVKNHEDELRDLGTKDHFDKRVHARYGPLYDEYNFEGRFFFAPKLLLALLCGMTTGMVWLEGLWQIIIMIALHIAFLFYLEVKQPYPTQFVQKTSSFVIIIKISALFLSFFLISSATSFNEDLPVDLREGVGFAIIGLQVLVLICLMIRQVYIFYRTWKLKKDGGDKPAPPVVTTNNRDGENFFALGDPNAHHATNDDMRQFQLDTPDQYKARTDGYAVNGSAAAQPPKLRNLQPNRRTHTVVVHDDDARRYRNNEVAL